MSNNSQEISEPNTRGAVTKLFGVILIILGALNTMLSWRGGFEVLSLPVIFLAGGLVLCLVGSILRHIRG
ncbi:MAG: hypothetical protein GY742_01780 [Hyphomicrobiales bacterium]|nr:hypothetical protein [Hyphomicrobiales bacterium]